jgi:hypothetical protein
MTRGAQRDRERKDSEKRAAKNAPKGNKEGLSAVQRKERDARIIREKQALQKAAAEAAEAEKNKK